MEQLHVGTSGWSYPTWRPGFYPAGTDPKTFLSYYSERFDTVELNTTAYRLPSEEQFGRWAEQTPPGFTFAVKLPPHALRSLSTFEERVGRLGARLGPIRVVFPGKRDEGILALLFGSLDPARRLALDFRHESWDGVELPPNAVVVNGREDGAAFRYLRFRDPPYDDDALQAAAAEIRDGLGRGLEVFAYFRHEDEPSAPAYAERLRGLVYDSQVRI
jgi:uncharacterized protein YecE (DUF72 family)